MTPQFTTPCYVRIDDAQQRKEVCDKLEQMGYKVCKSATFMSFPFIRTYSINDEYLKHHYVAGEVLNDIPSDSINCYDSIPMFLALAAMRSDTDKDQLFIHDKWGVQRCEFNDMLEAYNIILEESHRMSAKEIINYHKQKGETK